VFVAAYYLGISWLIPFQHHMAGLKISEEISPFITKGLINELHQRKRKIALFGPLLDEKSVQEDMIKMGIDILLTDRPDLLRINFDNHVKEEMQK